MSPTRTMISGSSAVVLFLTVAVALATTPLCGVAAAFAPTTATAPTTAASARRQQHPPTTTTTTATRTFVSRTNLSKKDDDGENNNVINNNNDKLSFTWPSLPRSTKHAVTTALASLAFMVATSTALVPPSPAHAEGGGSRVVGQLQGSGMVFKDTLTIESFDDPKVKGVTLYITNFQKPLTERLSSAKNFLQDPSSASVACAKTGPVSIADNIGKGPGGEEVFQERKSLLFKELRVQRVYDEPKQTLVYVSFNTRLDKSDDSNKSRFKSSICAIPIDSYSSESSSTTSTAPVPTVPSSP